MRTKIEEHLDMFRAERDNRTISFYIMSKIIPKDSFKMDYIMNGNISFSDEIKNAAILIDEMLPLIDFDEVLTPQMIQVSLLRGAYSFRDLIQNYEKFYNYTQKWLQDNDKKPLKLKL